MNWIGTFFVIGLAGFLVWAGVGTYLATTLSSHWQQFFVMAGAPTAADFWWHRTFPNAFDRFTLSRRFRDVGLDNADVLIQFEVVFWARLVSVAASVAFAISLVLLAVGAYEP